MNGLIDRMRDVMDRWETDSVRVEHGRVYVLRDGAYALIGTVHELIQGVI